MKIGVDARPLAFPGNGNARYLFDMLSGLLPTNGVSCVLYSHRPVHSDYRSSLERLGATFRLDTSWSAKTGLLFLNVRVPAWLAEDQCDVYWGSLSMLPLFAKRRLPCPSMVNFHDLNAFSAPETMTKANLIQHRLTNGHTLRNADRILCLSRTTLEDIAARFPEAAAKLDLVYPGLEMKKIRPNAPEAVRKLKSFYLMVGTIEPRKNQKTVVDAYAAASRKKKLPPLVIVGRRGWGSNDLYEQLQSGVFPGIHLISNASDEELEWCFTHASLYLFPSLHEGFGLPILEAALRKIPMVLSDIPVFREAGGSSLFVRPLDQEGWIKALLFPPRKTIPIDRREWSKKNRAAVILEIARTLAAGSSSI
jgi:glycosyltransferase involved in cell wall biosynthesis